MHAGGREEGWRGESCSQGAHGLMGEERDQHPTLFSLDSQTPLWPSSSHLPLLCLEKDTGKAWNSSHKLSAALPVQRAKCFPGHCHPSVQVQSVPGSLWQPLWAWLCGSPPWGSLGGSALLSESWKEKELWYCPWCEIIKFLSSLFVCVLEIFNYLYMCGSV